ncbi:hypothetical protein KKD19_04415 [Patescibacteria group bacterium]|nr:hypothetical protein [Patescibacteria group bacterium]MBU4512452.1 hypothetical protein [Patescibacteria group bacterium]MCG2692580.1 hypothetical protein [Candidatus Parcubacteria bacterium]
MDILHLKKILKLTKAGLILFFVFLFCYLFYKDFVPSGKLVIINNFQNKSQLISDLYPDVRVEKIKQDEQGNFYQTMFIDPVYFKINPPRAFRKATIKIVYKNKEQSLFQIGLKLGEEGWVFDFKTLEFQKIDDLSWYKLQKDNLILLQKSRRYREIDDFLLEPPTQGRIAQFGYTLELANPADYLLTALNTKTDLNHISYIIARYIQPEVDDSDIKTAQAEFFIDRSFLVDGKLVFIFSAPEMDVNKREIDIYEIQVALEREPLKLGNTIRQAGGYLKDIIVNF